MLALSETMFTESLVTTMKSRKTEKTEIGIIAAHVPEIMRHRAELRLSAIGQALLASCGGDGVTRRLAFRSRANRHELGRPAVIISSGPKR